MLFGISSAPEVFQQRMHELIEGLGGTEVVADDFTIVGFGDTQEEAVCDYTRILLRFFNVVPNAASSLRWKSFG